MASSRRFFLILVTLGLASGCTPFSQVSAVPGEGQSLTYRSGSQVITSELHTRVSVTPPSDPIESSKRVGLVVAVENLSDVPIEVSEANIQANSSGQSLTVYTADSIKAEIQRAATWAAVGEGLRAAGASMNAANAGYSTHSGVGTTTGTYNSYGSYGSSYGSYNSTTTYHGTTYNAAAAQEAQARVNAESNARMSQITSEAKDAISMVQSEFLQLTTLRPGEGIVGRIVVDLPKQSAPSVPMTLIVNVGQESHEFVFSVDSLRD